jgi:acyl-CoA reductase-like NAD-dependent aldehyde dehydrogenase
LISPVTGDHVGTSPLPVQADLDAADRAQCEWATVNVWEPAAVCRRVADEIDKRRDELARLQTLEQGKPLAESVADVTKAVELSHTPLTVLKALEALVAGRRAGGAGQHPARRRALGDALVRHLGVHAIGFIGVLREEGPRCSPSIMATSIIA